MPMAMKKESREWRFGDTIFLGFITVWISALIYHVMTNGSWENKLEADPVEKLMMTFDFDQSFFVFQRYIPHVLVLAAAYVVMVFAGPLVIKEKFELKPVVKFWNVLLSVFSTYGSFRLISARGTQMWQNGWINDLCVDGYNYCYHDKQWEVSCLWLILFCGSKIPEMIDTVLLVLTKKNVIFLHWFHHTTVMIFCWLAWAFANPVGVVYAMMNFVVHSFMYFYYFIAMNKATRPNWFRPLITWLQIIQMIFGVIVTFSVAVLSRREGPWSCQYQSPVVIIYGVLMYMSYLFLFAKFFVDNYCVSKPKKQ